MVGGCFLERVYDLLDSKKRPVFERPVCARWNRLGGGINRFLLPLGDRAVILLLTEVAEEGDCQISDNLPLHGEIVGACKVGMGTWTCKRWQMEFALAS
jgi:hypothetical protein